VPPLPDHPRELRRRLALFGRGMPAVGQRMDHAVFSSSVELPRGLEFLPMKHAYLGGNSESLQRVPARCKMRDPYEVLGVAKTPRPRTSNRPTASWPRSIIRTRIRTIRRRRSVLPRPRRPMTSSVTRTSAPPSTAARSTVRASRASPVSRVSKARPAMAPMAVSAAGSGPGGVHFEFRGAGPGGGPVRRSDDIFAEIFGNAFAGKTKTGPRPGARGARPRRRPAPMWPPRST
jgi:hypothetical protein